jgi:hypothetical protein
LLEEKVNGLFTRVITLENGPVQKKAGRHDKVVGAIVGTVSAVLLYNLKAIIEKIVEFFK